MYSSRVEYYKQLKDEFQGAVIAYMEYIRLSGLILTTEFMNKSWSILSRT